MAQNERPRQEREPVEASRNPGPGRWTVSGPMVTAAPAERVQELVLSAHATVAHPAALGMAAYAATSFVFGADLADWNAIVSGSAAATRASYIATGPMLLIFGGLVQFITAMWAFRKGSTFWATFLGAFGSLFLALSTGLILVGAINFPKGVFSPDVADGVSAAMFAFIAAYLTWAALGESRTMVWVSTFLTVSLALLSAAFFMSDGTTKLWVFWASGYALIVSGLAAFYVSAAIVINSSLRRGVLPY